MKKLLFILVILLSFGSSKGQFIAPTTSKAGWTGVDGTFNVLSNRVAFNGTVNQTDNPWTTTPQFLAAPPSLQAKFISLSSNFNQTSKVTTSITGLTPGRKYELTFSYMTALYYLNGGATSSVWADKLEAQVLGSASANTVVGNGITSFSPGINTNKWLKRSITFFAPAGQAPVFEFSTTTSGAVKGAVNLDIDLDAIKEVCPVTGLTSQLNTDHLLLRCPSSSVNLGTTYVSGIPSNSEVVWYTNANHSGSPVANSIATAPGVYYAFIRDKPLNCFNTDNSTAKVAVAIGEVKLSSNEAKILCAGAKYDLSKLVINTAEEIPSGAEIRWFGTPNHTGPIINPTAVGAGTYYAFLYYNSPYSCYNTDNSTAKVVVTEPSQVSLGYHSASVICLTGVAPLPTGADGGFEQGQPGKYLRYFKTNDHSGTYYSTGQGETPMAPIGDYYVFVYDEVRDCYNVAISTEMFSVKKLPNPTLSKTSLNASCPTKTVDLTTTPANPDTRYRWFTNATHSGSPVADPTAVDKSGPYYLFRYDAAQNCYNTDISNAKVNVTIDPCVTGCLAGTDQVKLLTTSKSNVCPGTTVNLNKVWNQSAPAGTKVVWFDNPAHTGTAVADPVNVKAGTYYAFFYDTANNCYNTNSSTAAVTVTINACGVCNAGTEQVILLGSEGVISCENDKFDLAGYVQVPPGVQLEIFDNPTHSGAPLGTTIVGKGVYYLFFYDSVNDCFNTNNSTAKVTITQAQVQLASTTLTNTCPSETVNLYDAYGSEGYENIYWFTNPNHTGSPVLDPAHVGAGVYYAFIKCAIGNYLEDVSTSKVTVTTTSCAAGVQLALKVALQGSMPAAGTMMRNDLQKYTDGIIVGVLPKTDPYGNGAVYNDINNTAVVAGNVVDWIKVDIKSASAPYAVLQSKSLLLRPDGSVVDVNGLTPVFDAQVGDVFIVVRHRNHLAIMSDAMPFVAGQVNFDFTDNLSKAFNDGSVPAQMRQINGIWCMINGDVNQDNYIQNNDVSQTRNSYKQGGVGVYSSRDLNMNAFLENQDATTQRNRFQTGFSSILSKY